MSGNMKTCRKCGKTFSRPCGLPSNDWQYRTHCSRACASADQTTRESNLKRNTRIVGLRRHGLSYSEIAEQEDVSRSCVAGVMHRFRQRVQKRLYAS